MILREMKASSNHLLIPRCRWRILLLLGAAGLVPLFGIAPLGFAVDADPARLTQLRTNDSALPKQTLQTVTNINQLYRLVERGQRVICPVRLEGVVCAADSENGTLWLKDESRAAQIELPRLAQSVLPGQVIRLTGEGVMEESKLNLRTAPVVDNDGVHDMVERSGVVYLKPGRHPIRVVWFNGGGTFGLEVHYQGPDLPRQMIPGSVLFREQVDPKSGSTNFVQGLNYRYCEGTNWNSLPDFNQLTNVKAGAVTNFDISVINQTNNVALEFTGYLELPREGLYTFSMSADDGSRLFVVHAQASLEALGSGSPPVPRPIIISQAMSVEEEHHWSEVEGTVTFVSEQSDGYELELSSGSGRMRVKVAGKAGESPIFLLNSQVRATGICWSTHTSEGQRVAGAMAVAGWKQIEVLHVAAERWTASPLVAIGSLLTNILDRPNEAIVRVQGQFRMTAAPDSESGLLLEDQTGQIPVEGIQVSPEASDSGVELLGKLSRKGDTVVFQSESFRKMAQSDGTNAQALPVLTSAKQVKYLSPEEAGRKYPVKIRGVITSLMGWRESFVLEDVTDGVFVVGVPGGSGHLRQLGDLFEVEGVTDPGSFAPTVLAERVTYLGAGQMPEPIRPNRDQLVNGSLDAKYVEVQGIVTAVESNGVTLLTLAGKYRVELYDVRSSNLRPFENALVRIKGCFYTAWDAQSKQIQIGQIRIYSASISVDEPAPADLFAAPKKTPEELLHFDATASALKRIKVSGQIVHERAGEYYMMNGTNGLRFFLKAAMPLQLGDQVEVVGFPELGAASPVLREAVAHKTAAAALPGAKSLPDNTLLSADHDATLVRIVSQLVAFRTNQTEQVLEMQAGPRTYLARLDNRNGLAEQLHLGSRLQLTGVYAGQGGDRAEGRDIDSFELLLNSPADIKVLNYPSWWTPQRILMMVGALVGVLLLALAWISGLRRQVEQQTRKLKSEIEDHERTEIQLIKEIEERKRTQVELEEKKVSLEKEIEERKRMEREIENTHKQLLEVSRQAGQAEVATNVLHNVGNVLNSVNTSAGVIGEKLRASKLPGMTRILELLEKNRGDLPGFFASDVHAQQFQNYLKTLNHALNDEQLAALGELACLTRNIDHIKDIVAMQQSYAMVSGVTESILPADLLEDSVRMNASSLARHDIEVVREFQDVPPITVEKHKALQILVNLIRNAKQACDETGRTDKRVTLRIANGDGRVRLSVSDNGIGIPPENLTRIFNHGFTTRKDGHGFGLHSGALAAKEMGGALSVHSEGPGKGATFTLQLPAQTQESIL